MFGRLWRGLLQWAMANPIVIPVIVVHDISYVMRYIMNASIIYSCK